MASALGKIETMVFLMMENRSFDHMLGYLSLDLSGGPPVDGLRDDPEWRKKHATPFDGRSYEVFPWADATLPDPPHDRAAIAPSGRVRDCHPG